MRNNQSGRSMIEMLGVLAIIGVLSVGGIAGYSKAMSKYRSNKVIEQISMLVTNTRTMYAQQQTYMNLTNWMAIEMGIVPDDLVVVGSDGNPTGVLRNVFGGPVQIASSSVDGSASTDKSAFIVSFYNLSRDACVAISTSDWGAGSSSGLLGMHVFKNDSITNDDIDAGTEGGSADATINDQSIDEIAKATEGKNDKGDTIAIPGDGNVGIPMRVDQARTACDCANKSTCAVSWKYY